LGTAITHHQTPAVVVKLVRVCGDVRGNLGLQRSGQHPPRALTHDLVDQRPAGRDSLLSLAARIR
jgi:hypothetical protein